MIESYFRNYIGKLKKTKKFARENNVPIWSASLINAVVITYTIALFAGFYAWILLEPLQEEYQTSFAKSIWHLVGYLPYVIWAGMLVTVLDKIIIGLVILESKIMKLIFLTISRFDMWYWRKYKKEALVSNALWRFQSKMSSMDQRKKRQIIILIVVFAAVYYLYKLGML